LQEQTMQRVDLDNTSPAVQKFVRGLPADADGIELAFGDRVVWKLVSPRQLAESEKAALLAKGKKLLARARQRNQGIAPRTIEKEIRLATATVRGERR
jgi:hypothetical protein